jgi:hypothetical protein
MMNSEIYFVNPFELIYTVSHKHKYMSSCYKIHFKIQMIFGERFASTKNGRRKIGNRQQFQDVEKY